jgi:hypothetical protein
MVTLALSGDTSALLSRVSEIDPVSLAVKFPRSAAGTVIVPVSEDALHEMVPSGVVKFFVAASRSEMDPVFEVHVIVKSEERLIVVGVISESAG